MKHKAPSKYIFLDVDGVINIPPFIKFNKRCIANLQAIINLTGAKIVVSSSWRDENSDKMRTIFLEHGFTEKLWDVVVGITCRGWKYVVKGSNLALVRGNEIKTWVDIHLKYPWIGNPELDKQYQLLNTDGTFKMMEHNELNKDYWYVSWMMIMICCMNKKITSFKLILWKD